MHIIQDTKTFTKCYVSRNEAKTTHTSVWIAQETRNQECQGAKAKCAH